jgi:hypothetical protein
MIRISNSPHWQIARDFLAACCGYWNMRDDVLGCVAVIGTRMIILRKRATMSRSQQPATSQSRLIFAILFGRDDQVDCARRAQATFSSFWMQRTTGGIGVSGKLVFQLVTPTSPT